MQGTATTKNPLIVIAARKRRYFFRVHICFHYTYLYTHIKERSSIAFLLYLVWTRQKQVDLIKYERKGPFFLFFIFIYLFFSFSELLFLFFPAYFKVEMMPIPLLLSTFSSILFKPHQIILESHSSMLCLRSLAGDNDRLVLLDSNSSFDGV